MTALGRHMSNVTVDIPTILVPQVNRFTSPDVRVSLVDRAVIDDLDTAVVTISCGDVTLYLAVLVGGVPGGCSSVHDPRLLHEIGGRARALLTAEKAPFYPADRDRPPLPAKAEADVVRPRSPVALRAPFVRAAPRPFIQLDARISPCLSRRRSGRRADQEDGSPAAEPLRGPNRPSRILSRS